MNYQWYPGHMTKAVRMMQENIKLIDLIIELIDARVPLSSRNPDIDRLGAGKYRIVLLNKSDLADPSLNRQWKAYFEGLGTYVLELDARSGAGIKAIHGLIQEACREKIERDRKRGIVNRPVRAMVVGIPNVGKSTFINSLVGKAAARTGNKPGVTKGKQWIHLNKSVELLDTPGILWPKFESPRVGRHLAYIGSMNDEILITEELAADLAAELWERYSREICGRYGIDPHKSKEDILLGIAESRHCFGKGGEADIRKAAAILLDDFRSGRLGRMTLELPPAGSGAGNESVDREGAAYEENTDSKRTVREETAGQ